MFDESFRTILFVNPARLSLKNSNLFVQRDGFDDVSLPLNDIAYIILESPCITLSSALLSKLASSKTILLTCDDNHIINGIFNPYLTHFEVNKIIKLQVSQGDAQKSILWQRIIKSKISNQAKFISLFDDKISENLMILQKRVKLSDSQNCEANAAAIYFKALFSKDFTRDDLCFINSALNNLYSIIRACLVRDIVSSGLLPNFGLWHDSVYNQFNLADDLMEPFRIYADRLIYSMMNDSKDIFLDTRDKQIMIGILDTKVMMGNKSFTLAMASRVCVQSYKHAILSGENSLDLPEFV